MDIDWLLVRAEGLPPVLVRPPALQPGLARLTVLDGSLVAGLRLELHGSPGVGHRLERSPDLRVWEPAAMLVPDAAGRVPYTDPLGAGSSPRFYRARSGL
jgi:hypothetical protein